MLAVAELVDVVEVVEAANVIVMVSVVEFRAELLSFATTVVVLAPAVNVRVRLQMAVPVPVAVSLAARTVFTVTDETPLSPRPESVAVPDIVIELVETV